MSNIKLNILGKEVSLDESRKLYNDLKDIFEPKPQFNIKDFDWNKPHTTGWPRSRPYDVSCKLPDAVSTVEIPNEESTLSKVLGKALQEMDYDAHLRNER